MKRTYLLILLGMLGLSGRTFAQSGTPCGTDEMNRKYKAQFPQVTIAEKVLEENIKAYVENHPLPGGARTTAFSGYYDIPVVVHIMHNYGPEVLTDNAIYALIDEMNKFYSLTNDTSQVIKPFKKYVGNAHIRFHLARKDPNGNPTNGITRHRTYLTYGYDDQGKLDQWNPTSYFNIWFENVIGRTVTAGVVLAYSTFPASAVGAPFWDGVICGYQYINDGGGADGGSTLDHESGHYFNLLHPWNSSGKDVGVACGDDGVDDTPPTKGHFSVCPLYDTACAEGYQKMYADIHGNDSLVDYPDTTNTQNVMDYSGTCTNMFTKGQVVRMHAALNSDVAGRNNLWDSVNLVRTGAMDVRADLKPIPEFSAYPSSGAPGVTTKANYMDRANYFTFPGVAVKFINETWNDTVSSLTWTFSNTASIPTATNTNPIINNTSVTTSFADPGWVTLSMKAKGNNQTSDTTVTWPRAVYVADAAGTPGLGYFQEFNGADTAKWPLFNYYGNNLKWKMANVGYYDNSSVEFVGFDDRTLFVTGNPMGDFDDMYTVPFDLSMFGSSTPCSMNFFYSAASRSAMSNNINDQLEIAYSTNKNTTWTVLTTMKKSSLVNKGAYALPYVPVTTLDWALFSMDVPTAARSPYTVFRFRYKPGIEVGDDGTTATGSVSSGNNFYMDRLTFSPWPAGVDNLALANVDVAVVPNPTSGYAYVIIKDADNTSAKISVTDVTGKVIYTATEQVTSNKAQVLIPRSAIQVSGLYLVHVVTGNQARTQKLIVQ